MTRSYPQYIKPSGKVPSNAQLEALKSEYAREHRESQVAKIADLNGAIVNYKFTSDVQARHIDGLKLKQSELTNSRDNWRLVAVVSMVVAFVMSLLTVIK